MESGKHLDNPFATYPASVTPTLLDCAVRCSADYRCKFFAYDAPAWQQLEEEETLGESESSGHRRRAHRRRRRRQPPPPPVHCELSTSQTPGSSSAQWSIYTAGGRSARAVDTFIATCALLAASSETAWFAVDLGKSIVMSAVKLITQRSAVRWSVTMAEEMQSAQVQCTSSDADGVNTENVRSSTCALDNDRMVHSGGCAVSWDMATQSAKLPQGRYVRVNHLSDTIDMKLCDIKVSSFFCKCYTAAYLNSLYITLCILIGIWLCPRDRN